jgi:hypothetical protein
MTKIVRYKVVNGKCNIYPPYIGAKSDFAFKIKYEYDNHLKNDIIDNIDDEIMEKNNSIITKTKLLDRCNFLNKSKAQINLIDTESSAFGYNLSLIDSNLHRILADMLLLSYQENEKDIKKLLDIVSNNDNDFQKLKNKNNFVVKKNQYAAPQNVFHIQIREDYS